jgi:hypothetical protein
MVLAAVCARPIPWPDLWKGPGGCSMTELDFSSPSPCRPVTQLPFTSCSTQRSLTTQPETRPTQRSARPESKRMPRKIRYARPVACQGEASLPRPLSRLEIVEIFSPISDLNPFLNCHPLPRVKAFFACIPAISFVVSALHRSTHCRMFLDNPLISIQGWFD